MVVVFAIHWHESATDLHLFPIPIPPPACLPIPSLWVFQVHQPWALVSCIQPGLVVCFTLDSILISMLFSQNIPPSPSPSESQSLFCTSVSLFLFCILGYSFTLQKKISQCLSIFRVSDERWYNGTFADLNIYYHKAYFKKNSKTTL